MEEENFIYATQSWKIVLSDPSEQLKKFRDGGGIIDLKCSIQLFQTDSKLDDTGELSLMTRTNVSITDKVEFHVKLYPGHPKTIKLHPDFSNFLNTNTFINNTEIVALKFVVTDNFGHRTFPIVNEDERIKENWLLFKHQSGPIGIIEPESLFGRAQDGIFYLKQFPIKIDNCPLNGTPVDQLLLLDVGHLIYKEKPIDWSLVNTHDHKQQEKYIGLLEKNKNTVKGTFTFNIKPDNGPTTLKVSFIIIICTCNIIVNNVVIILYLFLLKIDIHDYFTYNLTY